MTRTEILGRESSRLRKLGHKGCAYIGKVVSYPAGRWGRHSHLAYDSDQFGYFKDTMVPG